nr:MAG TPA: hypothetical protein [Caudoviricetes sp.]DAW62180.1 MAG TPA: hypothetical protein [Caudoviricetes sp.]
MTLPRWSAPCRHWKQRGGAIALPLYFNRVEIDPFRKD